MFSRTPSWPSPLATRARHDPPAVPVSPRAVPVQCSARCSQTESRTDGACVVVVVRWWWWCGLTCQCSGSVVSARVSAARGHRVSPCSARVEDHGPREYRNTDWSFPPCLVSHQQRSSAPCGMWVREGPNDAGQGLYLSGEWNASVTLGVHSVLSSHVSSASSVHGVSSISF